MTAASGVGRARAHTSRAQIIYKVSALRQDTRILGGLEHVWLLLSRGALGTRRREERVETMAAMRTERVKGRQDWHAGSVQFSELVLIK